MFSYFTQMLQNPLAFLQMQLYRIPAILIALTFHEVAHGFVAYRLGDPTAKQLGRLSLNPLRHLDPLGTLMMVFLGFGFAKPVPVNPRNFKHLRRDDLLVSIAGPLSNLVQAIVGQGLYLLWLFQFSQVPYVGGFLQMYYWINLSLMVFNLLPLPPLDGYHVLNSLILRRDIFADTRMMSTVLFILAMTGMLGGIISTLTGAVNTGILTVYSWIFQLFT